MRTTVHTVWPTASSTCSSPGAFFGRGSTAKAVMSCETLRTETQQRRAHQQTREGTPRAGAPPPGARCAARTGLWPAPRVHLSKHALRYARYGRAHHKELCLARERHDGRGRHVRLGDALRGALGTERKLPWEQLAVHAVRIDAAVV